VINDVNLFYLLQPVYVEFLNYLITSEQFLCTVHDKDLAILFSTIAGIVASLTAIIFSISIAFVQMGSQKYNFNVLDLLLKGKTLKILPLFSFIIIVTSSYCILFNCCSQKYGTIILVMMIIWLILFVPYCFFVSNLLIESKVIEIIEKDLKKLILKNSNEKIRSLLKEVRMAIIRSISTESFESSRSLNNILSSAYFLCLKERKTEIKKIIFTQYHYIAQDLLSKNNQLTHVKYLFFFEIISHEISVFVKDKQKNTKNISEIDFEFIDYLIDGFLFNLNKLVVLSGREKSFYDEIVEYSLSITSHLSTNPFLLSNKLNSIENSEKIDPEIFKKFPSKFAIFSNKLYFMMVFNFDTIKKIDINTDIYANELKQDLQLPSKEEINKTINRFKFEILAQNIKQYAHLRILKLFFVVGSYILFHFENKSEEIPKYLKILWDHTNSQNSRIHFSNKSPVTYDIDLLTKLYLFGGRDNPNWSEFIDINFGNFSDEKGYIDQYYILFVTWIINNKKSGNNKNLKFFDDFEDPELRKLYFKFESKFKSSKKEMLELCDNYIIEKDNWNSLFNDPKLAFENTKKWIAENSKICEESYYKILADIDLDPKKIEEAENHILQEYNRLKESEMISGFEPVLIDEEKEFKRIALPCESEREWFIDDSYLITSYINEFYFSDIGKEIFSSHFNEVINTLISSKELQKYGETLDDPNNLEDFVCSAYSQMKNEGFNPKMILMPNKLQKKLIMGLKDWTKINCEYQDLPIISFYDNPVNSLFLVDPSAAVFEYDKKKGDKILEFIVDDSEDKIHPTLRVNMGYLFEIVEPRGIMEIKISEELLKDEK